jgi:eukaryotic-like serine/threonine-protein kinase
VDIDARYELLDKVGSGSFATVYRARDLELGREVAIKQIHLQYLEDPKQLDRYWAEAQLLASLHHPNIVTIFDIYRERGWLILELMQSNLAERMAGRQMDLRALRTTLAHCLRALKYLHSRGIIHGDIKPANMMIDARRRVKLGDFGLARRVSDDEGSLLKGTTKYMAPEVVSEEFGEIGPASDLYSLGFASYDLMCGPNFESLFPGLSAFGRNKQVAWMMWHAAADRRLPEISRVLEGVPDDLQHVIPKLCEKDQTKRYKSADDALSDLKIDLKVVNRGDSEIADSDVPPGMDPARRKRLLLAGAALLASLIVCVVLVMLPSGKPLSKKVNVFMVQSVDGDKRKLRIIDLEGKRPKFLTIPGDALIALQKGNSDQPQAAALQDLKPGDRIEIEHVKDEGKTVMKIVAARPLHNRGYVQTVDLQEGRLRVVLDDDTSKEVMSLRFPERIDVVLNLARDEWNAAGTQELRDRLKKLHRITRNEVRPNDRVEVSHLPEVGGKRGYVLTGLLFIDRIREFSGKVVSIDAPRERMTVALSNRKMNLPLHKECRITLREEGKPQVDVKLNRLKKGDFVTFRYDTEYREIHATRSSNEVEGTIAAVRVPKNEFVIALRKTAGNATFAVNDKTRVQINSEPATFADLRYTDRVKVLFETGTGGQKTATIVTAERLPRVDRRVLLAGVRRFDDKSLPELGDASANVNILKEAMLKRYAVENERLVALGDPTAATLKREITDLLDRSGPNVPNVVIYVCTHGFVADGKVYLAGRKIDAAKIGETGWPLDDLLALVEKCRATNKILLLDLSHEWKDTSRPDQPSTAEMLKLAKTPLKTTTVIAANSGKERGRFDSDKTHGVFALAVARGFRGSADANGDLIITGTELFADQQKRMKAAGNVQTPARFGAK